MQTIDNLVTEVLDTCSNCGAPVINSATVITNTGKELHACSEICYDDLAWSLHDEEMFGKPTEVDNSTDLSDL